MKWALLLGLVACGGTPQPVPAIDAPPPGDAGDAATDTAGELGVLAGMCGVIDEADLTSASPRVIRARFTFDRPYVDPDDRPLLTEGGQVIAATPNAGGSSGLSEVFAFEQLARCEQAALLETETGIMYDTTGALTDLLIELDGHKVGVSVTRAVAFPFGSPYTMEAATTLITKKLGDILESTANVSAEDRWTKQILAVIAWDDQAADTFVAAHAAVDPTLAADTILVVTATDGEDTFLYSNN